MLATADPTNVYHQTEWNETLPMSGLSWLNVLTAESIPEETDGNDSACSATRQRQESDCSSSSMESCYVVLEIQRPRTADEISTKVEQSTEEEEEEEIKEEVEELHFAQVQLDHHNVELEQIANDIEIEVRTVDHE